MTQHEAELIRTIREAKEPAKALETAIRIITEFLTTNHQ